MTNIGSNFQTISISVAIITTWLFLYISFLVSLQALFWYVLVASFLQLILLCKSSNLLQTLAKRSEHCGWAQNVKMVKFEPTAPNMPQDVASG